MISFMKLVFVLSAVFFYSLYAQQFTLVNSISLPGVAYSTPSWGDYDNDGDLDILLSGYTADGSFIKIYTNDRHGAFTELISAGLMETCEGGAAWGDYDNDGDLDILLSGAVSNNTISSKVYTNNGNGTFTHLVSASMAKLIGAVAWGDYDNDGDLDVLLSGQIGTTNYNSSIIYTNKGNGNFVELSSTTLTGVSSGSAKWGDYDNDGDLDILLTGYFLGDSCITRVYTNFGNGVFTRLNSTILNNIEATTSTWGDFDSDGDLDILINRYYWSTDQNNIFVNEGNGIFSCLSTAVLPRLSNSSCAWGDYDNDGDIDVIMTGTNENNILVSKIFTNMGNGIFNELTSVSLPGVYFGSAEWGDFDNDGDLDILLTGITSSTKISQVYRNNNGVANTLPSPPQNLSANVLGNEVSLQWNKSTDNQTPQNGLHYNLLIGSSPGSINALSPMSDDTSGFRRVIRLGNAHANNWKFKNAKEGTYYWRVQAIDAAFAGSQFSTESSFTVGKSVTLISPNGGEHLLGDSLFQVRWLASVAKVKLEYSTDNGAIWITIADTVNAAQESYNWHVPNVQSTQCLLRISDASTQTVYDQSDNTFSIALELRPFTLASYIVIPSVYSRGTAWGDYDNDGDLDVLLSGYFSGGNASRIYTNKGNGIFSELASAQLTTITNGAAAWGDYDNDGDLDLLMTGTSTSGTETSKIYTNNGGGIFTELSAAQLKGLASGSAEWGDYDNDGDLDIVITGNVSGNYSSLIYINKGNGVFGDNYNGNLPGVGYGSANWGDYDNDGDLDVLLTGGITSSANISRIYKNIGNGTYTEQTSISLPPVSSSSASWGDYDNDGDLDILLSGYSSTGKITKIFTNRDSVFIELTSAVLTGIASGSAKWGDYDNDGDLDVLLTDGGLTSKVYTNNGNGMFTALSSVSFPGNSQGASQWVDFDNDGDLDIFLTCSDQSYSYIKIYQNHSRVSNTLPSPPSQLSSAIQGNTVTLHWAKSTDTQTPQNGLHYNLLMGTSLGSINTVTPMADVISGYRRIVKLGNTQPNSWVLNDAPTGTYYWKVQAIDGAYAGSRFSAVDSFSVGEYVSLVYPNGGESFFGESSCRINWQGNALLVNLDYSLDNGATWIEIAKNISSATESYEWTTPNISSQQYKIRISSSASASVTDQSDSGFTVIKRQFSPLSYVSAWGYNPYSIDWGDFDNDGDLDILIAFYISFSAETIILVNNGRDAFSRLNTANLPSSSFAKWGDYDNDGDLDIFLSGYTQSVRFSKIYTNQGSGIFTELTSAILEGMQSGRADWGDYDNDGDLDLLIAGNTGSTSLTKIYTNKRNGIFTEYTTSLLTGAEGGSTQWGDYDNDGDLDILLTGYSGITYISKVYTNNGNKGFKELLTAGLTAAVGSSSWGDYDNDGDLDILLTGYTGNSQTVSKIYTNNGIGGFNELTSTSLAGASGSAAWGDYDNDGDLDILLAGTGSYSTESKVYTNNGNGSFSEFSTAPFFPAVVGDAAWGDFDNDGDLDLILGGSDGYWASFTRIYKNNGTVFNNEPLSPTNLSTSVQGNNVTFHWDKSIDNQTPQNGLNYNLLIGSSPGRLNILSPMSDSINGYRKVVHLGNAMNNSWQFKNAPAGTFYWRVQAIDAAFAGSQFSAIDSFMVGQSVTLLAPIGGESFAGDSTVQVKWSGNVNLISLDYSTDNGSTWSNFADSIATLNGTCNWITPNTTSSQCRIRISDQENPAVSHQCDSNFSVSYRSFSINPSAIIEGVIRGATAWGDIDNDGDLDFLITGQSLPPSLRTAKIYINNGNGTFTELTSAALTGVELSSTSFGDYDNDGDLDLILAGSTTASTRICKIYTNNGNAVFTELSSANLPGVSSGTVAWGDYDNDGDLDVLLTGSSNNGFIAKIYTNNGNGIFPEQTASALRGVYNSSAAWGDYDNDGDLDILLTGTDNTQHIAKIYTNAGSGIFSELDSTILPGVSSGSVAWGDYDNDGDLDILLTGYNGTNPITRIFANNANSTFSEITSASLPNVYSSSVSWGDYDNDGDLDIVLIGYTKIKNISSIYINKGNSLFEELTSAYLRTASNGSVTWSDYDNDGDLDILLAGGYNSSLYKNNNQTANTLPIIPVNLTSEVLGSTASLRWDKSTDLQTPQNGLHYNLLIGSHKDSMNILAPMADTATGFRMVTRLGNSNSNSWQFKNNRSGKYYWRVQAIDAAFAGSQFSRIDSFLLGDSPVEPALNTPKDYALLQNYPNPFNPSTVITFCLPAKQRARLVLYNQLGQQVKTLLDDMCEAGITEVPLKANDLSTGVYFYQLSAGNFRQVKKMILLK